METYMKIVAEKTRYHRFSLYYDYNPSRVEFCKMLKDSFGWEKFSFAADGDLKRWVFSDSLLIPVIAERFPEVMIEPSVKEIVAKDHKWTQVEEKKVETLESIKLKTDTDFQVKGLKKELYAYQRVGIEFLVQSGGRAILADAPGVGKSAQAIGYVKHMGYKRTLIVSPASVKFSWANEVKKWTNMTSVVIDSKTDLSKIDSSVDFWIINYDVLKKHHAQLSKIRFDCILGDEVHMIKSPSAIRTKAFRSISREVSSIILISGTPLLSRPSELFSLLNIIDQKNWNNWYDFARKYCDMKQTRWGVDTSGASNTEELHARIKKYFIRRDKTQVLKELPPKNFIDLPILLPPNIRKEYDTAANDLARYLRMYGGKQSAEISKALAAEKLAQLNVLRQLSAMGKVDTAIELIESIIESGEKVLVFGSFMAPLDQIKAHFKDKAVMITGTTPVEERGAIVNAFQNDKKVSVFIGGYKSAGVGITLTAAQTFIGLDYPWNPADLQQAVDRLHRPGQVANCVNIYQLDAVNTIDEDMKEVLKVKQNTFDQIIEGKTISTGGAEAMDLAVTRILREY